MGEELEKWIRFEDKYGMSAIYPKMRNSKSIEVLETSLNVVVDTDSYVNMGYLVLGQNVQSKK